MQVDHHHTHKVMALMQLSDSDLMGRLQDGLEQLGIDPQAFKVLVAESPKKGNGSET